MNPPLRDATHAPSLLDIARSYRQARLSVIPIRSDGSKAPALGGWKQYQARLPTPDELAVWFAGERHGLAILGGAVSGGLEILDFDDGELFLPWCELVDAQLPGLLERLPAIRTPGGGWHVYYRCAQIAGNQKLAQTAEGTAVKTSIETRGEGGYVLAPGCPLTCHPQQRPYVHVRGPALTDIPEISPSERQILLASARSFHRVAEEEFRAESHRAQSTAADSASSAPRRETLTPGDDYNQRGPDWAELLPGWVVVRTRGSVRYWRRPGKDDPGCSATTGYCKGKHGEDLLVVFSTNAPPFLFPPGKAHGCYSKFAASALLHHGGNYKAAAKALRRQGYGEPLPARAPCETTNAGSACSAPLREMHLTDLGNARQLVQRHGADLRYCHPWGKWLVWDGRRWAVDQTAAAERRAKETVLELHRQAVEKLELLEFPEERMRSPLADEQYEKLKETLAAARDHYHRSESYFRLRAMLSLAQSEPGIPVLPEELDRDPWLLNVQNGTLDLRSGELKPHDRASMLTKLAPVAYDPQAPYPLWDRFLRRITDGKANLLHFLRRMAGMALTGDVSEQCLFFLYGKGANGKSTFLGALLALLGDYGMQAVSELLMARNNEQHPTERADLHGKRLVACIETEEGKRMAESLVKQLTGGDRIRARRMREDFWEFAPTHKIYLAANHKPNIRGRDHAMWRRIHLVPFTVTIPDAEKDKILPDKLKAELSGILNWCVAGCLEWQRDGLGVPAEVREATAEYRDEMDHLARFLEEHCEFDPGYRQASEQLFKAYLKWAQVCHERPMSRVTFASCMEERGLTKKRTGRRGGVEWYGVALCQEGAFTEGY